MDLVICFQYVVGAIGCSCTFFFTWKNGHFTKLKTAERFVLCFGVLAIIVWFPLGPAWANYVILIGFVIAWSVTFARAWQNPFKESPTAWIIWTVAFTIVLINAIMRWEGRPVAVINPAVLMLCHLIIVPLGSQWRRNRFLSRK